MVSNGLISCTLSPKFCLLIFLSFLTTVLCIDNQDCKPRSVLIETGKVDNYISPRTTWAYKCSGSHERTQKDYKCVATSWQEVDVEINIGVDDTKSIFKYNNHTRCAMKCSCSKACEENYNKKPKEFLLECPMGSNWDFNVCACIYQVGVACNKELEGKELKVSVTMFVVALVIEFIIILIVIFLVMDICKYRHDSGILHKTAEFVRSVSHGHRDDQMTLKRDRNDTGSESFLNGYSTVGGKIDHV